MIKQQQQCRKDSTSTPEKKTTKSQHGTYSHYTNHGCRCDECRKANAKARHNLHQRFLNNEVVVKHGDDSTYKNWGCRCDACAAIHSKNMKAYRKKSAEKKK